MSEQARLRPRAPQLLLAVIALAAALLAAVDVLGHARTGEVYRAPATAVAASLPSAADVCGDASCAVAASATPDDEALGCLAVLMALTLMALLVLTRPDPATQALSLARRAGAVVRTRAPPRLGLLLAVQAVSRT